MKCANCNVETNRNPDKRTKSGRVFCSQSCAATFNNKLYPKRPPAKKCKCGKPIQRDSEACIECYTKSHNIDDKTIEEFCSARKNDSGRYTPIRVLSRKKYSKSDKPKHCVICGYDTHYEICHIKGIASFPKDTLVKEVNSLDNLIALCPNHHWEFDNDFVKIVDGEFIPNY